MEEKLIAPCGMNCAICSGYLAYTHKVKSRGIRMPYCAGCRPRDKKCAFLKKKCQLLLNGQIKYCYECQDFPCERLRHIDQRYQTFYRMSLIENLKYIKENGRALVKCCGNSLPAFAFFRLSHRPIDVPPAAV